ncbi:MAG: FtsW/RodA/SpoVE family cell cycle protein, partial [Clostridiales bacterium]|nr:FtsW/RodA/SpoVE family cell cycle protein [Clostridiales bacterium]
MAQDKTQKDYKITDIDQLLEPGSSAIPERAKIHTDLNPQNVNIPMLLMVFGMIVFGLVVLYSVSGPDAYGLYHDSAHFLKRQLIQTLIGLAAMTAIMFIPIKVFQMRWVMVTAFGLSLALAVWTLAVGVGSEHGATRWVNIGPIQFQSSEVIKVALIVAFANYRSRVDKLRREGRIPMPKTDLGRAITCAVVDLVFPAGMIILVDLIIILQPHVSCFIIIGIVIVISALVSEIPLKSWITGAVIMVSFVVVIGGFVIAIMPVETRDKVLKNYAHVFKRIAIFNQGDDEEEETTLTK